MAKLSILRYPDYRLYTVAQPVAKIDARIKQLVADMAETMYDAPGIGLAATQVDEHIQLLIIDISEEHDDLRVFINPKILTADGSAVHEEGCLSVPGIYDKVTRAEKITVEAMDLDGKTFTLEADGLMGVCIQHEMDHLLGKVFVQYLSPLKQSRIKNKLKKRVLETM
ncbi:peptide deformylase [Sulfuriferula nivalis]|jgi:peptide deformylase|uniref:Peptide deformylase n=1 Tax=Sulfuriferula nivalis TaxID=2675298 RepID=A0A809RCC1_9PROT|nr:peptide deformylase [Sulfuriferula nivalis]BBO99398.1 peptide deformylase [Sulfuriferula nivalis]